MTQKPYKSIKIETSVYVRVQARKIIPEEPFSSVIRRLLEKTEQKESTKEEAQQASLPSNQTENLVR
jgi:predicted CopG family antitoxin